MGGGVDGVEVMSSGGMVGGLGGLAHMLMERMHGRDAHATLASRDYCFLRSRLALPMPLA